MASVFEWYRLTKPGIIRGNAWHFIAGALIAVPTLATLSTFAWSLLGMCLVIAAACVVNNIFDASIDAQMKRTTHRATASGRIGKRGASLYAAALLILGLTVLLLTSPFIVSLLGLVGFITYSFVYTFSKYHTKHSTLIGTVPGALPVMAGYASITGMIDLTAVVLFFVIMTWQMVHFYAIAVFRRAEYSKAKVPVLSVVAPFRQVWTEMAGYVFLYGLTLIVLTVGGGIHWMAGIVTVVAALWWARTVFHGKSISARDAQSAWARTAFHQSLLLSVVLVAAGGLHSVLSYMQLT